MFGQQFHNIQFHKITFEQKLLSSVISLVEQQQKKMARKRNHSIEEVSTIGAQKLFYLHLLVVTRMKKKTVVVLVTNILYS